MWPPTLASNRRHRCRERHCPRCQPNSRLRSARQSIPLSARRISSAPMVSPSPSDRSKRETIDQLLVVPITDPTGQSLRDLHACLASPLGGGWPRHHGHGRLQLWYRRRARFRRNLEQRPALVAGRCAMDRAIRAHRHHGFFFSRSLSLAGQPVRLRLLSAAWVSSQRRSQVSFSRYPLMTSAFRRPARGFMNRRRLGATASCSSTRPAARSLIVVDDCNVSACWSRCGMESQTPLDGISGSGSWPRRIAVGVGFGARSGGVTRLALHRCRLGASRGRCLLVRVLPYVWLTCRNEGRRVGR